MKKLLVLFTVFMFVIGSAYAEDKKQDTCPVKGKSVSSSSKYVDAEGYRIYVCCGGCVKKVKKDPAKYIAMLKKKGITPEKAPMKK